MLNESELLAQNEDDYMNDAQVAFFKNLLEQKAVALKDRIRANQNACVIERQPDDADFASTEEQRTMAVNMIERDNKELVRVNRALAQIESGEYGYCVDLGEPIGVKRLLLVPESPYSVEAMRIREAKGLHQRVA